MPQPFSLTGGNMKYSGVGGQAVMEGVMMKNEDRYAVAVRKPDHTIDVKVSTFKETIKNKKLRRLPFIRGVINFIESLILGMQTLMYSASFFEDDEDEKKKKEAMTQEERKAQEEKVLVQHYLLCVEAALRIAVFAVHVYRCVAELAGSLDSPAASGIHPHVFRLGVVGLHSAYVGYAQPAV